MSEAGGSSGILMAPRATDEGWMLAPNNAHAVETSELALAGLRELIGEAFRCRIVTPDRAFCVTFDQGARYASPNYLWFKAAFAQFVYVDRIVVAGRARGQGLAHALYADLMDAARAAGHSRLCCEVNAEPPNRASEHFHAGLGFTEVGAAMLAGSGKTVRYLVRPL